MKITSVKLHNFRGYHQETRIQTKDLCVLVGKNDIGKSSILEALDFFFNEGMGWGCIKLDNNDINKSNLELGEKDITIAVEFKDLPDTIIIDSTNLTSLESEHLLTKDRTLEIIKKFPNAGKEKVFIRAYHPTNPKCNNLLQKKREQLQKILDSENISCENSSKNADMRKAIWGHFKDDLSLEEVEIDISKIDAKAIWDRIKDYMPLYSLFQSDRKNSDGDSEIQDPMKIAVREILDDEKIKQSLSDVAETVKKRLEEVSSKTLEKLNEMNPEIADSLNPQLPDPGSLKWTDVFKNVSVSGDEGIPINKRGSGVKRLVLLNFFRAEAERRQKESKLKSIIYSIEEPETSQHPDHQRKLIEALKELSTSPSTQVFLSTHSPEIVKRLEFDCILLIKGKDCEDIYNVEEKNLPYPSLNEVNYAAFGELSEEYHNELYSYINEEGELSSYKSGKQLKLYKRIKRDGSISDEQITLTEYIRHQIHHPENTHNQRYSESDLAQSIADMRSYIQSEIKPKKTT